MHHCLLRRGGRPSLFLIYFFVWGRNSPCVHHSICQHDTITLALLMNNSLVFFAELSVTTYCLTLFSSDDNASRFRRLSIIYASSARRTIDFRFSAQEIAVFVLRVLLSLSLSLSFVSHRRRRLRYFADESYTFFDNKRSCHPKILGLSYNLMGILHCANVRPLHYVSLPFGRIFCFISRNSCNDRAIVL